VLQLEWSCHKKVRHWSQRRLKRAANLAAVRMIRGLAPVWTKREAKVNRLLQKHHRLLHRHQYWLASQICRPLTCLYCMVSVLHDADDTEPPDKVVLNSLLSSHLGKGVDIISWMWVATWQICWTFILGMMECTGASRVPWTLNDMEAVVLFNWHSESFYIIYGWKF